MRTPWLSRPTPPILPSGRCDSLLVGASARGSHAPRLSHPPRPSPVLRITPCKGRDGHRLQCQARALSPRWPPRCRLSYPLLAQSPGRARPRRRRALSPRLLRRCRFSYLSLAPSPDRVRPRRRRSLRLLPLRLRSAIRMGALHRRRRRCHTRLPVTRRGARTLSPSRRLHQSCGYQQQLRNVHDRRRTTPSPSRLPGPHYTSPCLLVLRVPHGRK